MYELSNDREKEEISGFTITQFSISTHIGADESRIAVNHHKIPESLTNRLHLHDINDDTYAPIVDFFAVTLTLDDFRSNVIWGAAGRRSQLVMHETCKAEICYLNW